MKISTCLILLISAFIMQSCIPTFHARLKEVVYESPRLKIIPLSNNAFMHVSYLPYMGRLIGCNGLLYRNKKRVVVFDTPTDDSVSVELINWVEETLDSKVVAVVPGHFHNDCLGGLGAFHDRGAKSYANQLTCELAEKEGSIIPQNAFKGYMELFEGKVKIWYPGEGHTRDNIIGYIPSEKVMFGGCLVKSVGAGKGFVGDANQDEWTNTVKKVKEKYPKVEVVIPGHGKRGGQELLDFTMALFTLEGQ
ncbi:MAG: subclass B1 metallo-beta-lactamase [Bacteroidota bacterium]